MRATVFSWLGREFLELRAEGQPGLPADEATRALLGEFERQLGAHGLSLNDTVRTRLFSRDRPSRDQGSAARGELLVAGKRASSSSFIDPLLFDSAANVALDLLAMRPSQAGAGKRVVEFEPTRAPARYALLDGLAFLSGVTSAEERLEDQVADALAGIGESLAHAGTGWEQTVLVSCFLHRSQQVETLRQLLRGLPTAIPQIEYQLVEGYASQGRLIEIEVTATV
jgi:enamine deaminase RidA (YjgF/YER057c/UK114 family)